MSFTSKNLVSIIIPTYNRSDALCRAVNSVLSQSYNNIEIIHQDNITRKYEDYVVNNCVNIFADNRDALNTLEPQFVNANAADLEALRLAHCRTLGQ